jgi:hypothetical protein
MNKKNLTYCLICLCVALSLNTHAQTKSNKHEWLVESPRLEASARITNLKDGAQVESPFVVKFGMTHWGIAPADHDHPLTGHHHLLIDTELPIPLDVPIPFSDNYKHFGKGQMEAILDLPPGKHRLRLLLANHKHVPFFVYSSEVNIVVTQKNAGALPADYGKTPKLEILTPADDAVLSELVHIVFHASALNVANMNTKLANTGYFQLAIQHERKNGIEHIAFPEGQTEAWLKLPKGKVKFQLEFMKNPKNELHEIKSSWVKVIVK